MNSNIGGISALQTFKIRASCANYRSMGPPARVPSHGPGAHATFGCGRRPRQVVYTATGEAWHISSFNAQPEAPACPCPATRKAGASGWALNESISTKSSAA